VVAMPRDGQLCCVLPVLRRRPVGWPHGHNDVHRSPSIDHPHPLTGKGMQMNYREPDTGRPDPSAGASAGQAVWENELPWQLAPLGETGEAGPASAATAGSLSSDGTGPRAERADPPTTPTPAFAPAPSPTPPPLPAGGVTGAEVPRAPPSGPTSRRRGVPRPV
jgi:hypothetical protein